MISQDAAGDEDEDYTPAQFAAAVAEAFAAENTRQCERLLAIATSPYMKGREGIALKLAMANRHITPAAVISTVSAAHALAFARDSARRSGRRPRRAEILLSRRASTGARFQR